MNSTLYKQPLWVVGDIHGHFGKMKRLLQDAGLIDESLKWAGGNARLWFIGDFFDRGPDGISSLALAMKLQDEAANAGGSVNSLIGNHEVAILSAARFPKNDKLVQAWGRNGGMPDEREKLTPDMMDWLLYLPLIARVEDYLLIHADAGFYPLFGSTRDAVNSNFSAAIQSKDDSAYEYLIDV
ncbi:MAG: metallophosphoesterase, partial [Anaerolineae bacterium]|nr:metallophosphoesterase [Anaerolineae bacterium]